MMLCGENMSLFKIEKKKELKYNIIAVVVSLAFGFILGFSGIVTDLSPEVFYLYVTLYLLIMLSLMHKNIIKGFFASLMSGLTIFGINGTTTLFFRIIGQEELIEESILWLITYIIFFAILVSFVLIFSRYLKKRIDMNIFNNKSIYAITAISGIMIILSYINYRGDFLDSTGDIMYALFFISVILLFVIIIKNAYKENSLKTERLITEASRKYIQDLEESYTAMRTIKHDYVNIMSSFKLYIENNDMAGLAEYYTGELSEMNKELLGYDRLIGSLQNIKINEIKSVLIYKCSFASHQQIEPTIEVRESIENLGVSTAIVCQILGILMDNAIEAILEAEEKQLGIAVIKNPNSKTFIIKNTWKQQKIAVDKLFELGFSTKSKDRGIGLYTIRNYTEKINNLYLETEIDGIYFTQTLTVKDAQ